MDSSSKHGFEVIFPGSTGSKISQVLKLANTLIYQFCVRALKSTTGGSTVVIILTVNDYSWLDLHGNF
jgi:hypothetical protein